MQITLCVIVAALLLVVAAVPNPVAREDEHAGQPAYRMRLALADLRAAIVAYRLDHRAWPGCAPETADLASAPASAEWFERQLTRPSGPRGEPNEWRSGEIAPRFGPYLPLSLPKNAVNGLATVRVLAADEPWPDWADGSTGWIYQPETGEIRANAVGAVPAAGVRYYQL